MQSRSNRFLITFSLMTFAWGAGAQAETTPPPEQKPVLGLDSAMKLVQTARAYADAHHWPCAISVVDDGGWDLASARMDGAPVVAGFDLAQGKARTAALFKRPSDDLEKAVNGGRFAAVTAGLVMMKGGQPITRNGQVIGGIGVSADTPAHDDEIALAALGALAD